MNNKKNYNKALVQLRRDKDYFIEKSPKMLALKSETLNNIKSYVNQLQNEIYLLKQTITSQNKALDNLRNDTQLLVTYCELRGVNPNTIFHLSIHKNPNESYVLKDLVKLKELNQNKTFTQDEIVMFIAASEFTRTINRGLLEITPYLPTHTPEAIELKTQIINDCSQSIYKGM